MKHLLIISLLLAAPLRADQNLAVLDDLFAALHGEVEAATAVAITHEIWAAWLQHDDEQVRALMEAGIIALDAGRWGDALGRFDAAIARAPNFAEGWNKRATVYYLMGDFAASSADVMETLRLEPRHFGALTGQGMMHLSQENIELALRYFRRALISNPRMDNVRHYVGRLSRAQEKKTM